MRRLGGFIGAGLLAATLLATSAVPVAARGPAVYHGTWDHAVNGECDAKDSFVMGKWNVTLHNDGTAVVSIIAFTARGEFHASFGGNYFKTDWVQQEDSKAVFHLEAANVFGWANLSFVLDPSGQLTYTIAPYCEDGSAAQMIGYLS